MINSFSLKPFPLIPALSVLKVTLPLFYELPGSTERSQIGFEFLTPVGSLGKAKAAAVLLEKWNMDELRNLWEGLEIVKAQPGEEILLQLLISSQQEHPTGTKAQAVGVSRNKVLFKVPFQPSSRIPQFTHSHRAEPSAAGSELLHRPYPLNPLGRAQPVPVGQSGKPRMTPSLANTAQNIPNTLCFLSSCPVPC